MVPAPTLPLKVKNTFIDIDERFIEEDFDSDLGQIVSRMGQRQVTEPVMCRQSTPLPVAAGRPREEAEQRSSIWADQNDGLLESAPVWDRCVTGDSWHEPPLQAAGEEGAQGAYAVTQGWIATELVPFQLPCIAFDGSGAVVTAPGGMVEMQDVPADWGETLTVMMRNLPNKYTQQMLLEEINQTGFAGTYDFLYLPIDPETKANRGYAFINFVGPAQSWAFKNCYEGRQIGHFNSGKVITVMPATLQGFEANHAHYASARVSRGDPSLRPLFLREPSRVCTTTSRQAPLPTQRRRRGRMSLIDAAAQRSTGGPPPATTMMMAAAEGFKPQCRPEAFTDVEGGNRSQKLTIRFCPYCGGKAEEDFRFCKFCGKAMPEV